MNTLNLHDYSTTFCHYFDLYEWFFFSLKYGYTIFSSPLTLCHITIVAKKLCNSLWYYIFQFNLHWQYSFYIYLFYFFFMYLNNEKRKWTIVVIYKEREKIKKINYLPFCWNFLYWKCVKVYLYLKNILKKWKNMEKKKKRF